MKLTIPYLKNASVVVSLLMGLSLHAQNIGVNTTTPDASAALDVSATDKGMLVPRMTTAQKNAIASPATGLLVFDTNLNEFWYFNGTIWTALVGGGTLDDAYDYGGAGAGRTITADANPVVINGTGIVTSGQGRLHVTTVGGSLATPSVGITGTIGTATSVGFGIAGEITNADNPGAAIDASSNGTGQAFSATMTGTGAAGLFQVSNASSIYSAVSATSNGSGDCIQGTNSSASGRAGAFATSNASSSTEAVYVSSNSANQRSLLSENIATTGTGFGHGITGRTSQSQGTGVIGSNFHTNGTGVAGAGNNVTPTALALGSGTSGTSSNVGVFGVATTTNSGTMGGYFWLGTGATIWSEVATNYGGTGYGIISNFAKSTIAKGLNNENRVMFCTESPEILFEDYGHGQLTDGQCHIDLDPIYAKNIKVDENNTLRVFIQLEGDCNGVFVEHKSSTGFDVKELAGGKSNVRFTYHVIGNRVDFIDENGTVVSRHEGVRFPAGPDPKEQPLIQLVNENDEKGTKPLSPVPTKVKIP